MENGIDHGTLIKWVNDAEDATTEARAISERCRDYYDSKQWTDAEVAALKKRKQAATVINRIKPKIDGLLGMEKTQRTTAKAFARTPKHAQGADAVTQAVRYVLDDNFYHQARSSAFENICVEGIGGIEVVVDQKNPEKIKISPIFWDRLFYDPHSRRKNFSDARYLGQFVWMDFDEAKAMYPEGGEVLDEMIGSASDTYDDRPRWMTTDRKRCKVVECYYRHNGTIMYSCFTRGGLLKPEQESPYVDEEGNREWPYEFASAFVDRENQRYGAVKQLLDIQDEINKRRSKALHLLSVRQVRWERGAVEDINKARQELARPDGVVETTPGMEFEVLKTGDMAAAQFNLLAEAKQEIDAVGYNAAVSGKEERALSGRALLQRQQAGQTELAPLFDVLKHLDIRVYRKIYNRVRQYWKQEKWIRVTDDEQNLRWVGLNKPVTKGEMMMKQAEEQGAPPQILQQLQMRIQQDPMMQEVVSTENDIANLDVDIVMDDAPDSETMQVEEFQVLGEMVKSGIPIPPDAIIEASPLSNKDKILKRMRQGFQLSPEHQQQMQKMQEDMQKLAEENQKLKTSQEADMAKIAADRARAQEEIRLERDKAIDEINLARWKAEEDIKTERMKVEGQQDVQKAKIKGDLAVKSIELGREVDPEEDEKKKKSEQEANDKRTSEIINSIVTPIVREIARPRKKRGRYKGAVVEIDEI